ncbi:MAG: hypothetical protein MJ162_01820 [Treponema sp.]|nr:hypothetical protein [Treponema sp.]
MKSLSVKKVKILALLLCTVQTLYLFADEPETYQNYRETYSYECQKADDYAAQYREILTSWNHKDPDFIIAIAYPELTRFSTAKNSYETFADIIAYCSFKEPGCYSIGEMQMKPDFAEMIENMIKKNPQLKEKYSSLLFEKENYMARFNRLLNLGEKESQLKYMLAFVDICMERFNLKDKETEEQIRIISTAYNAGINWTYDQLKIISQKAQFPYGRLNRDSLWNYSTVSIGYYRERKSTLGK